MILESQLKTSNIWLAGLLVLGLTACDAVQPPPVQTDERTGLPDLVTEEPGAGTTDPADDGDTDGENKPDAATVTITANGVGKELVVTDDAALVVIAWNAVHATSCLVEPAGWEGVSGSKSLAAPTATNVYTVTCEGDDGLEVSDSVKVTFSPSAELTVDLKVNGENFLDPVADNTVVQVTWTATGAEQCAVAPKGWTGVSGDHDLTVTDAVSLIVTCTKGTQSASDSVNLSIMSMAAPVATFALTGTQLVDYDDDLQIVWSSVNADDCEVLETGWTGATGTETLTGIIASQTLTLVCTGAFGEDRSSLTINVNPAPAPTATLTVNGTGASVNVTSGDTAAVAWVSANTTSCAIPAFAWSGLASVGSDTTAALTANVTVVLTCVGPGGTVSDSVLIEVGVPSGLTADIDANGSDGPVTIAYNATATIGWTSSAANCTVTPGGQTGASGSHSTGALTASVTYTLNCATGGSTKSDVVTVNVDPAPVPVVAITANNTAGAIAIKSGNSATIRWTATNATSCLVTSSPGTANWTGLTGARASGALTVATVYTASCSGAGGERQASVTVNMKTTAPTVDLRGNGLDGPLSLVSGASVALTWTSTDATGCTVTPGGYSGTSGSQTINNVTSSRVYTISCTGDGGSATDTLVVNTQPAAPPTVNITANGADGPVTVASGATVLLGWTSSGAASCSGPVAGETDTEGSLNVTATVEKTYTVTCTNPQGSASDAVTVKIAAAPPTTYTFTRTNNVTYCTAASANLALDLARPNGAPGLRPAIIFVHGGGWTSGSRAAWSDEIEEAATRGYVAVSISYRLTGALFPGQVEDVKCAIRWMRAKAGLYSVDTARIGIAGKSAGAHLSMMAALTDQGTFEGSGGFAAQVSTVKAILNWYGPTDMKELYNASSATDQAGFRAMFGGSPTAVPAAYANASPITFVDSDDPPIWAAHGTSDGTVPYAQSTLLKNKANQVGLTFTLETITGAGHGFVGADYDQAFDSMFEFFSAHL